MRILVTNDDGIEAKGIKLLVEKALKYGKVFVVAPVVEQSAKSHSINIKRGLSYEKIGDLIPGVPTYTVDSTPADCIRFAKFFLKEEFDIVFSGINHGFNAGEDIIYSGTVAGASEAVFDGKKGIAFSSKYNNLEEIDKKFDDIMAFVFANKLLDLCPLYNINVPLESKGIKITQQGSTHFDAQFILENEKVFQKGKPDFSKDNHNSESDVFALYNGFISITPLTINRTDKEVFGKIKKLT